MPYALPADPSSSSSTATTAPVAGSSTARPGHRRTRSSFSDERGPGAFASMGALPRRRPSTSEGKRALFHLSGDDNDSPPDDDASPAASPAPLSLPLNSLKLSLAHGRFSPSVAPPAHIDLPKATITPASPPGTGSSPSPGTSDVPFPTSSPLSPTDARSPFLPGTPPLRHSLSTSASSGSIPRTPSTPIILSNGRPLKPSLKSSSSSPNVMADFAAGARKHARAQSAPSTPRVHFAEKDADLATVRVYNRTGKPASLSKPAGEETETETEAEYPFPTLLAPGSFGALAGASGGGGASPSQLLHEVDPTPGVTSAIPNPAPPPAGANIFLETVTLPRTRPPTLRGTVLVRNIHFEKSVVVRFTLDDWQTTSEVSCRHVVSLPGLPPPFPRPRSTLGDVAGQLAEGLEDAPQWDRFSFTIRLEDYEAKLSERTLYLVARFAPCHGALGEFWDNNDGRNYRVGFRRVAAGPATPLGSPLGTPRAAPALAASASFPAGRRAAGFAQVSTFGPARRAQGVVASQQRTFSAPSSLKVTPVTGSRAAVSRASAARDENEAPAAPVVVTVSAPSPPAEEEEQEEEEEKEEGGGEVAFAARVPLFRRHSSAPHEPRFPVPPPIATAGGHGAREPAQASPVQKYISRRLSLSNYVAPGAAKPVGPVVERREEKTEETGKMVEEGKTEKEERKEGGIGALTPPSTPPREGLLKGLPDVEKEEKEDAQAMLSPLVMGDASPFSPTSGTDATPWRSLEAQLQLASPPVSRGGSAENSGPPTPVRARSPQPAGDGGAEDPRSPVALPQTTPGGTKVDTTDSSYAAFIRQWCFAQSTPPGSTPAGTPSPSATPPPAPAPPAAAGLGAFAPGNGVGPRRQQAWPAEQMGAGYGFPGFGFAQAGPYGPAAGRETGVGVVGARML